MNAKHSCKSSEWYTPASILNRCREVLGPIDLDPASDAHGNVNVRATRIITESEDGLITSWRSTHVEKDATIFINPPGGVRGGDSVPALFWKKLLETERLRHAIFVCFSLESLQVTQNYDGKSVCDFPICIPKKRIKFENHVGLTSKSPTHANAIVYVPCSLDATPKFKNVFRDLGAILNVGRDI